ncbi:hypothetical protein BOTBODRAFT_446563 [Botryobasidium botryosum FD-172 SS1]|uniref:Uncharacterized protein n=1 Tax=Botryobasidium botryosum (strain FD-172 SS1) TaxID=930990 RepID=A0A067MIU0_BOTB1|nr:hypothetical protein BOTBODRAFT_446563 [Botryobasidium botryosum FD-172 SS1]
MSSAVAAGHSPAPSATSAPTTPLRSSSRIRFDSAKKRDPNNVYSEACATADLDDEDGPVGLEVSDSGDEDHPPSDSSTPEEVPSPSVAAPPAKRQKVLPASIRGGARKPALRTKHLAKTTSGDQVLVDKIGADGFLEDVTAAISVELTTRKPKVTEKTSDIRAFFTDPFFPSGSNKAKRKCKKCK